MSTPLDQLMRQADPAEFYDLPPVTGETDDALYAAILERTETAPEWRVPRLRPAGPLLAAAVFVVLLIAVAVAALLSRADTEPDVVDQPPPVPNTTLAPATTTAAPEATTTAAPEATTTTPPETTTTTADDHEDEEALPDYPLGPPLEVRTIASALDGIHGSLSVDAEGRLYVGDWDPSNRIYRIDLDGSVEVWAETELLRSAQSSAFGPDGRLYVTSLNIGLLLAFDEDGTAEVITDQVSEPTGILFLPDGRLIVGDNAASAIFEVLEDGSVQDFARHRFFHEPRGLTLDDDGNIYVTNWRNGRLHRISPAGEIEELHQFPPNIEDVLYQDGVLYIAGFGDGLIYRYVLEDGSVEIVAGGAPHSAPIEGVGVEVSLFTPTSLATGPNDEIYLTWGTPIEVSVLTPAG